MTYPSATSVEVMDALDVHTLVAYMRDPARRRPVIVLSIAWRETAPFVPVGEVDRMAAGRADVVVLLPAMCRILSDLVVAGASVYQGACRVYPPGPRWEDDPYSVPLRMARDAGEKAHLLSLINQDLKQALVEPVATSHPLAHDRDTSNSTRGHTAAPGSSRPDMTAVVPSKSEQSPSVEAGQIAAATPTRPAAPTPPPMDASTKADAATLAAYLRNPARLTPALVVSRAAGRATAFVDVAKLKHDLDGLADVFEVTTLSASWAFAAAMPKRCEVYGGAGRVYPVGDAWTTDHSLSPLRLAYGSTPRDCDQLTGLLLSDAMRMASRGSYETSVAPARHTPVTGTVIGVAGDRGLVKTADGMAVLWPELTEPDLPAQQLFVKGMDVHGELDPRSNRIDVRAMRQNAAAAISEYRVGDTVLVRVASVAATSCTVSLFPGVDVVIDAQDATDETGVDLRYILSQGETTPAAIISHEDDEWLLSLTEADEAAAARSAPSILVGGPPWLVPADETIDDAATVLPIEDDTDSDEDVPTDADYVRSLRLEKRQLIQRLKDSDAKVASLKNQLAQARNQRREATRRRARADRDAETLRQAESDQALFMDERQQLDFEIQLAWARMIAASDKQRYPLKQWSYGDQFFTTLDQLQGVTREKIVEVIVHVLTGLASELPSRQLHRLRTGPGGDDPVRTRNNGEVCYRVSIQHKTPQARRIHYWLCHDGSIEFASVRRHDDLDT